MSNIPETQPTSESLTTPSSLEHTSGNLSVDKPRVVIIGGGFGGLQAAKALRHAPVQVTVIDRQNHHVFQPLLYWVATAGLSPADICSPIRQVLSGQKNTEVVMAEVTGIDVQAQKVLMHDRSLNYDYLVIATGAVDNYFGHKEWEQYAPGLKSIVDATKIRRRVLLSFEAAEIESDPEKVKELLTFVLVGAGPTGVEMAGAIAEIAHKTLVPDFRHIDPKLARVILVEAGPRILATFPESLARRTKKRLLRMGVEVRTGTPVSEINENSIVAEGERIAARTIIWTAGVSASPASKWLGAEGDRAGRVKVEQDLSLPGHPNIFVIGDTASVIQKGKPLPGVAPVAMQAGRYVASVIADHLAGKRQIPPFRYHDKGNLATVGRSYAIVDLKGIHVTGLLAWLMWIVIHIYYLIGFRNRLVALFQWAWTYFTYHRGARLITFDDPAQLT